MSLSEDVERRRLVQIERRLNELGCLTKGNQAFQADRIADVIEQIEAVRVELKTLEARVSRMAEFLNQVKSERKNGGDSQ